MPCHTSRLGGTSGGRYRSPGAVPRMKGPEELIGTGEDPLERELAVLDLFRFARSWGNLNDPVDDDACGIYPE